MAALSQESRGKELSIESPLSSQYQCCSIEHGVKRSTFCFNSLSNTLTSIVFDFLQKITAQLKKSTQIFSRRLSSFAVYTSPPPFLENYFPLPRDFSDFSRCGTCMIFAADFFSLLLKSFSPFLQFISFVPLLSYVQILSIFPNE